MKAINNKVVVQVIKKESEGLVQLVTDSRMQREGTVVSISDDFDHNDCLAVGDTVTFADTAPTFKKDGIEYAVLSEQTLYFKNEVE